MNCVSTIMLLVRTTIFSSDIALKMHKTRLLCQVTQRLYFSKTLAKETGLITRTRPLVKSSVFVEQFRFLSKKTSDELQDSKAKKSKKVDPNVGKEKSERKDRDTTPKISLMEKGKVIDVVTKLEAEKIAKRRNMSLVEVKSSTPQQRPVFKLVSVSDVFKDDPLGQSPGGSEPIKVKVDEKSKSTDTRGEKLVQLSHSIGSHDLETKAKMINKWLDKKNDVRIVITGDPSKSEAAKTVKSYIEKNIDKKKGKISSRQEKGSGFILMIKHL